MTLEEVLSAVKAAGGRLTPNGEKLTVEAPAPLSEALIARLVEHKYEILAVLTEKPPPGSVGRHGAPCPQRGDTWQWSTLAGDWICSWCFVQNPQTAMRFAEDSTAVRLVAIPPAPPAVQAGHTYCPGCLAMTLEPQGEQTTCQQCGAWWLPRIDLAPDAPYATIRVTNPQTGQVLTIGIYRCPQCRETRWGPRLDRPEVWCCLTCAGSGTTEEHGRPTREHDSPTREHSPACPRCGSMPVEQVGPNWQCGDCPHVWRLP
jgi:hypothetical protein